MYNTRKVLCTEWRPRCRPSRCLRAACSILVSLAFSLIAANAAHGATYYLDAVNGDDSNPGTTDLPWQTLSRAYAGYSGEGSKVQEGDTVYFRNGDYGEFRETGLSGNRTNWITYAAASGHSPNLSNIYVSDGNYDAYLKWSGFNVKDGISLRYGSYFYVYDCNVTSAEDTDGLEAGYYYPYFSSACTAIYGRYNVNHVTVEGCEIWNTYRAIRCGQDGAEYWTIKNNTIRRFAEDGIRPDSTDHLLIEGNLVYDTHKARSHFALDGTGSGTFEVGEAVIQAGSNAEGVVRLVTSLNKISLYTTTEALFVTAASGGGTVTGQTSGATMSAITKCDYSHSDPIQVASGAVVSDIVIRGNTFIASLSGLGYLRFYGRATGVTLENNLCYGDEANPFIVGGVSSGFVICNNTFASGLQLASGESGSGSNLPSIIDSLYNNIMLSYSQTADVNESLYNRVLSHGNNIFGSNPSGAGGPAYSFSLSGTEAVTSAFNALFTDAANNDYTLASGSAAIDFGAAAYATTTDKDGDARVNEPDVGCYEYAASESENNAPVLQSIGSKSVSENALLAFTVSAADEDGDTITYSASGLPSGATFSSGSFSWTPGYTQVGSYNVTFTASDGADSDSEVVTITVGNTNRAPVLASIGAKSASENTLLTFTVSAADADGDTITYSASSLSSGATFSSGSFSWTPGYTQAGSYDVTFTASDGTDSDSEVVTITVANTNRSPVLASIGNKSVNEGASLSFSASATDADGDSITYSASSLPTGAVFSGGSFSWTPGYTQTGSYSVTFTASDAADTDSEVVTISVGNVNRAPVLASIGAKSVDENSLLGFTTSATDADGDTITCTASVLPTGATFSTGSFSWTPEYEQAGSHNVTFTASDGTDSDSETITITVGNVNRAPVLEAIGSQSIDEGSLLSFSLSAADADGDSITYSAAGLPSGSAFASQTFTWTPGYTQAGAHEITFTAGDGADEDSETVTITVNNTNRAPVLDAVADQSANETDLLSFTVSAADADGDTLEYSASSLPGGASFTEQSFSWTPSHSQADNSYEITFTVSDGELEDSQAVRIVVSDASAPSVTGRSPTADSIQASLNNLVTLHVTDDGKGVDPATVSITLDGSVIYTGNASNYVSATGNCRRTGTATNYAYAYQPDEVFDFDETKTVTVNATDLGGNAMTQVSYSFRTEMRSFGSNTLLGSDAADADKGAPATASDSSGNIWAAWHAGPAGSRDIYIARRAAGATSFGAARQITTDSADQHNPALGVGTDDKLYVVWQDNRNGDWDIYGSTSTGNGTTWSAQRRITDSNDNQINPAIAIDSQSTNRAHVVWQDDRSGNEDIYIAVSANAFLTNAVTRITSHTSDQTTPAIAIDSSNTAYVVWTDARNATTDIYGASSGAWTNVPVVNKAANQSNPAIAAESTGSVLHFAWVDQIAGDSDIYYASSDGLPAGPLTGTNLIDDNSEADQLSPAIAAAGSSDDSLHVFVSWQDARNSDTDLYMVQANAANGTNVLVGDGSSNSAQSEPAIGLDQYDHPYLVWT
ncbi:MAG TPA: putative Ig domain-containing protein, partial [Sedimentisphaerales bacterium]|nr:putative Ig domain-containing protein [Sedimentisphaerales bacterium]